MTKPQKNILVATSKHPFDDARIYYKQVKSLRNAFNVTYLHCDSSNKNKELFVQKKWIYLKIVKLIIEKNIDFLIVHDFDLINIFSFVKIKNCKVIVDIHEDYPIQIKQKPYLNKIIRNIIGKFYEKYFHKIISKSDGVIYATEYIYNKYFGKVSTNQTFIRNYPSIELFSNNETISRDIDIIYIGGLSLKRGFNVIEKISDSGFKVTCAGPIQDDYVKKNIAFVKNLEYLGTLPYRDVPFYLSRSKIGLVPLANTENYMFSSPVKLFEYLASNTYVLCSDFKFWRETFKDIEGIRYTNFGEDNYLDELKRLLKQQDLNSFNSLPKDLSWDFEYTRLISFINSLI